MSTRPSAKQRAAEREQQEQEWRRQIAAIRPEVRAIYDRFVDELRKVYADEIAAIALSLSEDTASYDLQMSVGRLLRTLATDDNLTLMTIADVERAIAARRKAA